MADSFSLKIMSLFEAGARLECNTETVCLAAHIYHKFFKLMPRYSDYDLYMFASASIKIATMFFEQHINNDKIVLAMMSVIHGTKLYLDNRVREKLRQSVDFTAKIICINMQYQVDFKDTKRQTIGDLAKAKERSENLISMIAKHAEESDDDLEAETFEEKLLLNNSRYSISGQRYLTHYLKCIKLLIKPENQADFNKICDVAWTLLADFYWSPSVTQYHTDHIACASLLMAIKICLKTIKDQSFRNLLDKKWNLIFCDDLNNVHAQATSIAIVRQYQEYERVVSHEFNTYVIDPAKKAST